MKTEIEWILMADRRPPRGVPVLFCHSGDSAWGRVSIGMLAKTQEEEDMWEFLLWDFSEESWENRARDTELAWMGVAGVSHWAVLPSTPAPSDGSEAIVVSLCRNDMIKRGEW